MGIRIVIGSGSSAEVEAVKAYADENDILVISPSSTAISLAIPGDNVFRFVPDDTHQAEAIARLMWEDGVRAVIPIWRGDIWGDDLANATKGKFEELGGTVLDGIRYNASTANFSAELESLNAKVGQAIALYDDLDSVGVHLMAFKEVVPLFIQAGEQNAIFATVKWYGSDGTALNKELISNTQAAQFAIMTGFTNPIYGGLRSEIVQYGLIEGQIRDKIGRYPETFAIAAYDALWVATLSYLATGGTNDSATLKKALPQTAGSYFGATGWTALNEAGDRKFGDYDFWAVRADNGAFLWERVARYQVDPGLPGRLTYERQSALTPALRVLVVNSYHKGMDWARDIQKGIIEGLSRAGYTEGQDYELKTFCMDTKVTYTTPELIEQRAETAIDLIDEFEPDIVFVNNDNALKYVAVEYTKKHPEKKLPFVFSGVNLDPTIYAPIESLDVPGGVITGALERFPYYECFFLGKRIFPNASKIVLLADSSPSSTFVVEAFKERYLEKIVDSPLQHTNLSSTEG
jgi:branched-chain amino acid transport system substrate-binding protein